MHGCLEGPEAGVYYRGEGVIKDNQQVAVITLPDYVHKIAHAFTVQVTPIYRQRGTVGSHFLVSRVENGQFTVHGPPGEFFWHVHGTRRDLDVEPLRSNVTLKGNGPYRWIE